MLQVYKEVYSCGQHEVEPENCGNLKNKQVWGKYFWWRIIHCDNPNPKVHITPTELHSHPGHFF